MPKRFWVVVGVTLLVCMGFPNRAHGQSVLDLVISQGPTGPTQLIRSQSDTVTVVIKNVGTDTVKTAFDVLIYLSTDAVIDLGDRNVGNNALSSPLAPNDSVTVKVPVTVPSLLVLGAYQWLGQVDASGLVTESDETNNLGVGNVVQIVAPPADLKIVSGPTGDIEVNLNGNYTVSLNLKNEGAGPTQNTFEVAVFLSADSLRDSTDIEVGRSTISDKIFENTTRSLQMSVVIPATHPLGSFSWLAVVDVADAESETNETNNVGVGHATQVVEKLADLIVSAPPSGPNGVFRRGAYTVTTQIKNQGTGTNTSDFDVVIFLSEDLIVGNSDDVRIGDVAVRGVLGVDSTRSIQVPVTIPALQAYRAYQWVAVVDDVGFVSELNETNNSLIGLAVSVVPSPPDLVIENVMASTPVERSNVYAVNLDVVNSGDGVTTGAFQVSLFFTSDDSVGNGDDVRVGSVTVTDVLNAGDRKSVSLSMTVPSGQALGTYRLVAVADASHLETEANETNNATFANVPIDVVPSPPDLIFVTDPSGKERVFRGVIDTVTVQIRNQGIGDANGAFDVAVFLSADALADTNDVQVGTVRVTDAIGAGQTLDVQVPVVVPVSQVLGAYRWWARLDVNNALNESDETNNERVGVAVSIVHFPADITIHNEIDAPELVARGGIYQVSVPVQNKGIGPATLGYQVEIYLSENEQLDERDVLAGGRKFSDSFEAGAEDTVVVSVTVPLELPVSTYRWVASVTVVGLQDESDLGNNVRAGNFVVFPVMTVEPAALNFGNVRVGTSKDLTFEVLNGGTARLSFEIEVTDPQITVKPKTVSDLPPGVPWKVTVSYTPTEGGVSLSTALNIKSNDSEDGNTVALTGVGEVAQENRVFLDFDPIEGNQQKNTYHAFAQEMVSVSVFMNDVPTLQSGTIVVHYDSLNLAYVDSSWVPQGVFSQAQTVDAHVLSPGVLLLHVAHSDSLVGGTGGLGQLSFHTLPAFSDGEVAPIQVQQVQYQLADSSSVSIEIATSASVVFDLACWADVNGDGKVSIGDFLTFVAAFDQSSVLPGWHEELVDLPAPQTPYKRFDVNADGVVNLSDFLLFTRVFGQNCSR